MVVSRQLLEADGIAVWTTRRPLTRAGPNVAALELACADGVRVPL